MHIHMQNGNSKGPSNITIFNEYSTKPQTQINSQIQANQSIDIAILKYIDSKFESINQYLPLLFQLSQGNLPDEVQLKIFNFLEMLFANFKQNNNLDQNNKQQKYNHVLQWQQQAQEQLSGAQAIQFLPPEIGNQITKVQSNSPHFQEQPIVAAVEQQKPSQRKVAATPDQIQSMKQRQIDALQCQQIPLSIREQQSKQQEQYQQQLQQSQNIGVIKQKPRIVIISQIDEKLENMKPIYKNQSELSTQKIELLSHCCICELNVESTIRTKCYHLFCDSCFTNNIKQQLDRKVAYISCPYCSTKLSQQTLNLIGNVSIMKCLVNLINQNQLQKIKQINGIPFLQCKSQYCPYFCLRSKQYDHNLFYCPMCLIYNEQSGYDHIVQQQQSMKNSLQLKNKEIVLDNARLGGQFFQIYNKPSGEINEVQEQGTSEIISKKYDCALCHLSNWKSTIRTQCHHLFCDPCFNNSIKLQIDQNATELTCPCCSAKLSQQILQQVDNQSISQLFKSKLIANQLQKIKMHYPTKFISCMTQNCQYFCVKGKQQQQTQFYCPLCQEDMLMEQQLNKVTVRANSTESNQSQLFSINKNSNHQQLIQTKTMDSQRDTYRKLNNSLAQSKRQDSVSSYSPGQEQPRHRTKQIIESLQSNSSKQSKQSIPQNITIIDCLLCKQQHKCRAEIRTKCNHFFCDSCFTNNIKQQLLMKAVFLSCPYCSTKLSQQTLNLIDNVNIKKGLVDLINSNQLQKLKQINGISFIQCKSQYCSYFCIRSKQYDGHQSFCSLCLDFTVKN